jgi:alkylhydroperoxidase/carboxymuconolactone decarboxylase family protein YurZ
MEVIIQTGAYTGWPTMAHAVHQFDEVFEQDKAAEEEKEKE